MNEIQQIAIDYKRKISSTFISITQDDISSRIRVQMYLSQQR